MTQSRLQMDPVAKTAYYCCGVRAADARSAQPICGDCYAERFMDAPACEVFKRFEGFRGPNASNAARHRIVDDLLRERLRAQPDLQVVLLGAGFDTRAFRLSGGQWLELDQPALMALKESRLPAAEAPNPLRRVSIDFAHERLADKLAPWAGMPRAVVVMEGVSMYLTVDQLRATADVLRVLLPQHTLVCDLMTHRFVQHFGGDLRREIMALGGDFAAAQDDPASLVASFGYREEQSISIAGRAVEHGSVPIPRWLFNTVLCTLRDGYKVHVFEAAETSHP